MRILNEGDKSQAVCPVCKKLRDTTYRYATYHFPEQPGRSVDNVLQGFCDVCGTLAAIPAQSSPKIRKELRRHDRHVEARVPPPLEDVLFAVSSRIQVEPQLAFRMMLNFFTAEWLERQRPAPVRKLLDSPKGAKLLRGNASCRVSSRLDEDTYEAMKQVQEKLQVNQSDYFKAVLVEACQDLVENSTGSKAKRFYKMASILGPVPEVAQAPAMA